MLPENRLDLAARPGERRDRLDGQLLPGGVGGAKHDAGERALHGKLQNRERAYTW